MGRYSKTIFIIVFSLAGLRAASTAEPFTILDAINQAVKTHPAVGDAAANRRAIEAEHRQSQGVLLPQINLYADAAPEILWHTLPLHPLHNRVSLTSPHSHTLIPTTWPSR